MSIEDMFAAAFAGPPAVPRIPYLETLRSGVARIVPRRGGAWHMNDNQNLHTRRRFLDVQEVADILGLPRSTVYDRAKRGIFPGVVRIGFRVKIDAAKLEEWLEAGGDISYRRPRTSGDLIGVYVRRRDSGCTYEELGTEIGVSRERARRMVLEGKRRAEYYMRHAELFPEGYSEADFPELRV